MIDKKDLLKIIISALILIIAIFIPNNTVSLVLYITSYILVSYEVIIGAIKNILKRRNF